MAIIKTEKVMMVLLVAVLTVACQKVAVEGGATEGNKVGPVYVTDGKGGYSRATEEQSKQLACKLMRQQIKNADTQCTERVAKALGLTVVQCREYFLQVANVCEKHSLSKWDGDYSFRGCMNSIDQTTMCTSVLVRGCKYTSDVEAEVGGINLAKEREKFAEIMEKRCKHPLPFLTLHHAKKGSLELMLED